MRRKKDATGLTKSARVNGAGRNGNGSHQQSSAKLSLLHPTAALEQAIQRYVDLYEFAPVAYVSFDRVGRIEEINLSATQLFGRSRRFLIGSPFAGLVVEEDAHLFLDHLLRCRSLETRVETDLRLKKRSGEILFTRLSSSSTTSSMRDGVLLYQTAIVDLTERKRAEEAIAQSEKRYRTLFDLVPVAVYTCDAKGFIQEFNQRAVELWGRQPEQNGTCERFCGSFKIFYPDGRSMPHEKCPMARALRGEKLKQSDLEILVGRPNGVRRSVIVNPKALKNDRGKIIGAINCLYDITERKKREEAMRESEELHRALVTQTGVGMARGDLQGKFVFVNQKFCEMVGYKKSELIGKLRLDITHPDDIAESLRQFRRMITTGEPYQIEKRYVRKDGSLLWVNMSASPMRDARGKTRAAIAVVVDIGDRKQAQAMLESANALLENRVEERTRELVRANEELLNQAALRQRLEGEILEISEREQRRLGLDLHDSLCQHLTATAFLARAVALRLRDHRVIEVKDLEKIAELINEGVTEARTIARGLHPVEMDPAGLANALRALLHGRSKIPYRLDVDEELSIPNPKIALHLYRIASEAIINANKHARARELVVRVLSSRKGIELSVTDDGVGVSPKARDKAGMGFHIMDYRARLIGARLEIKLVNPHGTRVVCYVPRK